MKHLLCRLRLFMPHRLAGRALPLLLCLALASCTTPALRTEIPADTLLDAVPFIAQDAYACGPAALAMVMQFFGHRQSPQQLKKLLLIPAREGTLQVEMTAAARREGFLAFQGASNLESLLRDVAAGFPVIVLQNLRFEFWPQWHYAVVVGFDQRQGLVLLRSGKNALIEVPYSTFLNTWQRANRWALVVTPPNQLPSSATALSSAAAAQDLARSAHPAAALAAYATAAQHWPNAVELWNGLGNLAYGEQRWPLAQQAYAQSLLHASQQARIWNNFAYALQQAGCTPQATEALQCAMTLAPSDPYLHDSRKELDSMVVNPKQTCGTAFTQCHIDPESAPLPKIHLQ